MDVVGRLLAIREQRTQPRPRQTRLILHLMKHTHITLTEMANTRMSYVDWAHPTIEETKDQSSSGQPVHAYFGVMTTQYLKDPSHQLMTM